MTVKEYYVHKASHKLHVDGACRYVKRCDDITGLDKLTSLSCTGNNLDEATRSALQAWGKQEGHLLSM